MPYESQETEAMQTCAARKNEGLFEVSMKNSTSFEKVICTRSFDDGKLLAKY